MKTVYFLILFSSTMLFSCGSYVLVPKAVNDLNELKNEMLLKSNESDTLIIWQEGCSGCYRGIEKNIFIFKFSKSTTEVKRFSNFQEFKIQDLPNPFPWNYLFSNFENLKAEKITPKVEKRADDGTILLIDLDCSHGRYSRLIIKIGKNTHSVYMSSCMEEYYDSSINLRVLYRVKASLYKMSWHPKSQKRLHFQSR